MEINRRDFLRIFGGLSGAVALGSCGADELFKLPESLIERAKKGPGVETWKNTVCSLCPGGCGISVRLVDEVPVYIKGNPIHPLNQGGMCPLGLNALHHLYNPDRVTGPLKRIGKPGSGKWEPISWDDALTMVTDQLVKLRNEGKPEQVAFLGYDERGLMHEHISRFMRAYGSPNYYRYSYLEHDQVAYSLLHGHSTRPAYDFLNAKLVLSFGANFLEEGYSPVYYTKIYSHHRERETRYIQIEPRMSLTAANAERWVPIRPGTYGALALGIAHVLIREELYDADFVRNHTFGFEDWTDRSGGKHVGFRNLVLGNYYPDIVSDLTGVSSSTILELARDLGTTQPSIVLADQGAIDNTNGTFSLMAVHSLNALLGNFERDGGVHFVSEPPFARLPGIQQDTVAKNGNRQKPITVSGDSAYPLADFSIDSFAKNVAAASPYPISLLFLYKGNPLFQTLNRHDFSEALQKIPLIVSFDTAISETTEYADLILPDHTFLEKWDEISNVPSVGFTQVTIQHPVIPPLYDTRHTGDVLIDLAHRIGGTPAASFSLKSYEEMIRERLRGVYDSGEGAVISEGVRRLWLEYLQQRGWQIGRYVSFEEFWGLLLDRGGWWNPVRRETKWRGVFQTQSGRFEFYSQRLKATIDNLVGATGGKDIPYNYDLVLNRLNISARGDGAFLPHHEPVPYDGDKPLHLITFQMLTNRDGHGANMPMMQEMFGYGTHRYWQSWIEIHPETAARHGISDGAWVWVESSVGSLKVQAKTCPGIMQDVVAIPFGMGHTSYGRYAKGHGVNPNSIMKNLHDLISGTPALEATKVRISAAT